MKSFLMYLLAFLITNILAQLLNKKFKFNEKFWSKIKVNIKYRVPLFIVVNSITVALLSGLLSKFVPSSYDEYVFPLLLGISFIFMPIDYKSTKKSSC